MRTDEQPRARVVSCGVGRPSLCPDADPEVCRACYDGETATLDILFWDWPPRRRPDTRFTFTPDELAPIIDRPVSRSHARQDLTRAGLVW